MYSTLRKTGVSTTLSKDLGGSYYVGIAVKSWNEVRRGETERKDEESLLLIV